MAAEGMHDGGSGYFAKGSGGVQGEKQRVSHTSLVPATLRMLQSAWQDGNDDRFMIDGRGVTQVHVVGQIMSVNASTSAVTLLLDDGTGKMEVRVWFHEDPNGLPDYHSDKKQDWKEDVYVEVYGSVKSLPNNKRVLMGQRVRVVQDFNLITHHFLHVIQTHLLATKNPNSSSSASFATTFQKFDPYQNASAGNFSNYNDPMALQNNVNSSIPNQFQQNNPYNNQLDNISSAIVQICSSAPPRGVDIPTIVSRIPGATEAQVKERLTALMDKGDIYTAIEGHYKG